MNHPSVPTNAPRKMKASRGSHTNDEPITHMKPGSRLRGRTGGTPSVSLSFMGESMRDIPTDVTRASTARRCNPRFYRPPGNPSCRHASYAATAAALDRFMLRRPGIIGMRIRSVTLGSASASSDRPVGSGPNNSTSPGR